MNSKKSLKNTSFILFLGLALIFIGLVVFLQKKALIIQTLENQPSSTPGVEQDQKTINNVPTEAKVTRIIDGDTIIIDTGQHVRYIGMNTPEVETSECFASEASEINKNLVLGKTVKLEKDVSEIDKYGRLLRYVYVENPELVSGSLFVDDYLIRNGSAKVMTVPPDIKYKTEFLNSQKYAKENKLGLWGKCPN